ncbi:AAA family ATPase [Microbacterium kunmingense]|uniref:AAA family ATPase n=1 Tax=Microbacterium kunmingense TaxID=2915939 RepID=UPI00200307E2|nr:AAA family ATPase [Microbacterium kunmingense]
MITEEEAYSRARRGDLTGMDELFAQKQVAVTPSVITVPADIERQVRTVLAEPGLTVRQKVAFLGSNFLPGEEGTAIKAEILQEMKSGSQLPTGGWEPQDLEDVLSGSYDPPKPTVWVRSDGTGLLYPGVVNEIHAEAGIGKSWCALSVAAETLRDGGTVLYIDHEEHRGRIVLRLLSLGVTAQQIREGFHYIQPETKPSEADLEALVKGRYDLVVVDTVGESIRMVTGGASNETDDVTDWHPFTRAFARTGSCVLVVDHITKSGDNPLYPIGSQAKYAGYKGAVYLLEAPKGGGLTQSTYGYLSLKLAKDNGGELGLHKGDLAAEFHLDSTVPGQSLWELRAPDVSTQIARAAQEARSYRTRLLEAVPAEGITRTGLREAVGLRGNNFGPYADALADLIEKGELLESNGPRGSKVLTLPSSRPIGAGELGKVEAPSPTFPGELGKVNHATNTDYPLTTNQLIPTIKEVTA